MDELKQMIEKYQIQLNTVKEVIEKSDNNEDTLTAQAVERFLKGFLNDLRALEKLQSKNGKLPIPHVSGNEVVVGLPHCPNKTTAKVNCEWLGYTCWLCEPTNR